MSGNERSLAPSAPPPGWFPAKAGQKLRVRDRRESHFEVVSAPLGYDLTTHTSKGLEAFNGQHIDAAVTMGCGDACPLVNAARWYDWQIPDPREMPPDEFRQVRDLIRDKVGALLSELGVADRRG